MKVVRKGKCDSGPVDKKAGDIKMDTVFSGRPKTAAGSLYTDGVFLRCIGGFIRLEYANKSDYSSVSNYLFKTDATVVNYKELNAYLCIEE